MSKRCHVDVDVDSTFKDPRNYWYVLITAQTNSSGKGPFVIHSETRTQMTRDVLKITARASQCCIFTTINFRQVPTPYDGCCAQYRMKLP